MSRSAFSLVLVAAAFLVTPPTAVAGDWLHFGFDSRFTGHNVNETRIGPTNVDQLDRAWGVGCDDGYFSVISRSPAIRDGVLYTSGAGDRLRAYDAKTGLLLWEYGAGNLGWAPQPVASENGVVYYMEGSIPTELFAVDSSTGTELWKAPLGFDLGFNDTSLVTVDEANGLVYVVEEPFAPGEGKLFALNASTGEVEWYMSRATHDFAPIGDYALLDGGTIYVAAEVEEGYFDVERVIEINAADQRLVHRFGNPSASEYVRVPSISMCGDRLVAVYDDDYDSLSTVAAYDSATRALIWTKEFPLGVTGRIACNEARDALYVPTDPYLHAIDASSGAEVWNYLGFGPIFNPSIANGVVYFISDTNMYALDESDGRRLLRFPLGYEGYDTTQVAIADGMVFFSGNGGDCDLYALGLPDDEPLSFDGFVPAAASNSGAGGTYWGTTVWASHDSVFSEDVTLTLYAGNQGHPADPDRSFQIEVPSGQVVRIDDILARFPAVEPPAALFYKWDGLDPSDGLVTTRTFTAAPGGSAGTLGQGIIGIDIDELPPPGSSHVVPLTPDIERYRANLGVVNAGSGEVDFALRIRNRYGAIEHESFFSLSAGSWRQFNRIFSTLGIEPIDRAFAEVAPIANAGGSATARFAIYTSLVDNDSGDPTYLPGQSSWTGTEEIVIPAAAHNPGVGGTQWVTDVHAINWNTTGTVGVDVELLAEGLSNHPVPFASENIVLGADEHLFLPDIVGELFGETNRKGAITCAPSSSLNLWSRTYNDGESGTFGQSLPGLLSSRFGLNTFEDGMLIGLEESADYRTNIGLVNIGTASTTVSIRIYRHDGTMLDSISVDLEARSMRQFSAAGAYGTVRDGRVEIAGQDGVIAYASVIDNKTGDATTMLAKPVGW